MMSDKIIVKAPGVVFCDTKKNFIWNSPPRGAGPPGRGPNGVVFLFLKVVFFVLLLRRRDDAPDDEFWRQGGKTRLLGGKKKRAPSRE